MNNPLLITEEEYLMDRADKYPLTDEMKANMAKLIPLVNEVLTLYYTATNAPRMPVSSGYRPAAINKGVANAALHSKHMVCAAVDLRNDDGAFGKWLIKNLDVLKSRSMALEHPDSTMELADGPTSDSPKIIARWTHLQCVLPKSGHTVFWP